MTPAQMLDVLDDAIADAPWWRPGRVALELTGQRTVLGEHGRPVEQPDGGYVYGFTRAQCVRMRATILAAARADAGVGR